MPKGKKFDAAEKHFMKKDEWYQKQIKYCDETIAELQSSVRHLTSDRDELSLQNTQLKDWVDRLLEYTQLNEADIKKVCEQDKTHGEALVNFMSIGKMFGF